jgi:hypothetical protein
MLILFIVCSLPLLDLKIDGLLINWIENTLAMLYQGQRNLAGQSQVEEKSGDDQESVVVTEPVAEVLVPGGKQRTLNYFWRIPKKVQSLFSGGGQKTDTMDIDC